ncbi:acyltransferase [Hydrogenophaga sp.]|uniref:acyltransferase n=1 Tax=Hydrogenophaga sp. TaxID=1904254 RepID=UPI003F6A5BE0
MIKNQCDNPTSTNIRIETGAWVGARSIILSGACISEGSVLGAGSLCNNFIPPYVIAVGSPAKKLTKRFLNPLDLKKLLSNVSSEYSFEEIQEVYIKYEIPY